MSNELGIEQENVTIARFMGMQGTDFFLWSNYQYHRSWELLMPVVEKIEKDYCNIIELIIYSSSCCINKWNPHTNKYDSFIHETGNKLESVYKAVYLFITWYNQQTTTNLPKYNEYLEALQQWKEGKDSAPNFTNYSNNINHNN